jgi:hypothetical protein
MMQRCHGSSQGDIYKLEYYYYFISWNEEERE